MDFTIPKTQTNASPDFDKMDQALATIQQHEKANKTTSQKVGDVLSGWGTTPIAATIGGGIGALGGPAAPLTVPLGAFAGASVGKLLQRIGSYMNGTSDSNEGGIKSGIGASLDTAATGAGYATTASIIQNLPNIISWLTKGGVASKTNQAVSKATEKGTETPLIGDNGIIQQIRNTVEKKLGTGPGTEEALNSVMTEHLPAGENNTYNSLNSVYGNANSSELPDELTMTPQQILDTRRQITNYYNPKTLFGQPQNLDDKVAAYTRTALSQNLHQTVPSTKIPDWLYSLYSNKLIGSPLTWPVKAIAGVETVNILKHLLSGSASSVSDVASGGGQ